MDTTTITELERLFDGADRMNGNKMLAIEELVTLETVGGESRVNAAADTHTITGRINEIRRILGNQIPWRAPPAPPAKWEDDAIFHVSRNKQMILMLRKQCAAIDTELQSLADQAEAAS